MRDQGKAETVVYRGITFRRYPEAKNWAERNYYTPNYHHRRAGVGRLHQEVWKDAHGPIPEGYHVHHRDHNPINNALDNLELLSIADHNAHHRETMTEERRQELRAQMDQAREYASQWHKSSEGREWHRALAFQSAEARYLVKRTCAHCGTEFEVDNIAAMRTRKPARFCSNTCKTQWRKAAGIDDEERTCAFCGKPFTINRYSPTKTCSRKCASGMRFNKPRPVQESNQ